jgi:RNA polymerase-binding transcription factor DksA
MAKQKAKPAKKVKAKPTKKAAPKAAKKVSPKKPVAKKAIAKKPVKSTAKKAVKKTTPKPKAASISKKLSKMSSIPTKDSANKKNIPPMQLTANDNDVIANAKVRYSAKDLETFKKVIHEQREEAKEEFDIISRQLLDTTGEFEGENQSFALHTAEQGSDAMEREKQYLQTQRTSDFIKKLDEAIERIGRGTYGICVVCGELIEKQRLYAVPITQKHVTCKNKTNAKKLFADSNGFATAQLDEVSD